MNNTMVNEALAERTSFIIPKVSDSKFSSAELADDMDGLQLSFQRAKIPGGGVLQFELPGEDPENPDYVQTLEGVILFNHSANSYWPAGSEYDDNTPPQCQSVDGKVGYGDPGGICEACDYNKFGSDPNGGGKACKNMRVLYLLRSGEMMPIQLSLPPTSIRPFTTFVNSAFLLRGRRVCSGLVQIGLRKGSSNGFTYSVATFKKLRDFEGEELAQVCAYADSFRDQIKQTLSERASQNEAQAGDGVERVSASRVMPDNGDHFAIGGVIDGERDLLPA
ncbi:MULTISPECIES: hypothetical protein [Eubacteriales]|uniref:Uncharacterized protein n=1 Tax=Pseudoflavonifractor capillosus TaxID=106588 RepID=A0A921MJY8_9FIRM|nr:MULTISPECIES: hypothetical protein [Eubacteriales]HJG85637.1 hypothetical protein [Pseudoflavonifractor capillosus]